jgi:hypothetical protein
MAEPFLEAQAIDARRGQRGVLDARERPPARVRRIIAVAEAAVLSQQ